MKPFNLSLSLFFLCLLSLRGYAQIDSLVDERIERIENEKMKVINQSTNRIPYDLYEKALDSTDSLLDLFLQSKSANIESLSQNDLLFWQELGPADLGGRTRSIAMRRINANTVVGWAGSVSGGLWKNANLLKNDVPWKLVASASMSISSIDLHPLDPRILCYGTGEAHLANDNIHRGKGVFLNIEGGLGSNNISPGNNLFTGPASAEEDFRYIFKVKYTADGALWVGTWKGLYRLARNERVWKKITAFAATTVYDIEVDDNNIYVAAQNKIGKSPFRTTLTWTWLNKNPMPAKFQKAEITICKNTPAIMYAVLSTGKKITGFFRTDDGGATWKIRPLPKDPELATTVDITNDAAWYMLALEVNPNNGDQVFVGGMNMFKSKNAGQLWTKISYWNNNTIRNCYDNALRPNIQYMHADQQAIFFLPDDPDIVLFANDGGVFFSQNSSVDMPTITSRNLGYNVAQLYSVSIHHIADRFLAGTQDNGTRLYESRQRHATRMVNEAWDGGNCFFGIEDPNLIVTSYLDNQLYISTDGGQTFDCPLINQKSGVFPTPLAVDEQNHIIYTSAIDGSIIKWLDYQATPNERITPTLDQYERISFLQLSPTDNNLLFVGTSFGKLLKIKKPLDNFPTIERIDDIPWQYGFASALSIDKSDPDHMIMTFSSYGMPGVWRTSNALGFNPTWEDISGNLPQVPIRTVLILEKTTPNAIHAIVGTEVGVFSTQQINGANTVWDYNSLNLGNPRVDMLAYRESDKLLLAATHGRGLFMTSLQDQTINPLAKTEINTFVAMKKFTALSKSVKYNAIEKTLELKDLDNFLLEFVDESQGLKALKFKTDGIDAVNLNAISDMYDQLKIEKMTDAKISTQIKID